jgi:carbon starvation protein
MDYVPTPLAVLFGHHFASIAGAGPIIGPILAASYGWLGVCLWLVLGAVLAGGIHDMGAIAASVKHGGRSVGEVIRRYISPTGQKIFLAFAWVTLVLVIAAFDVIVAKTFVTSPEVATASILFLLLALVFGFLRYRAGLSLLPLTILGILGLGVALWVGFLYPLKLSAEAWRYLLFGYVFVAAVTPVWALLQPRDYLNAFLLYGLLFGGLIGLFVKGPEIHLPVFTGFRNELGPLFPLLFVVASCGAISGFHSLVGSGTTAKQLDRESHARVIGYGGMLLEAVLGLVALMSVAMLNLGNYQEMLKAKGPIAAFASGVGGFLSALGFSQKTGVAFAALAVSAFALTSLDTATRVARFALEELVGLGQGPSRRFWATAVSVGAAAGLALTGTWKAIWPLMGTANQLLAALALLALTVWLKATKRSYAFVALPAAFMFAVTLTALILLLIKNLRLAHYLLAVLALGLLVLALYLLFAALRKRAYTPRRSPQRTL